MTILEFILNLRPALPFSSEHPGTLASNSEVRRWIDNGSILINSERVMCKELMNFPVFSLVFFPKSDKRRTTIV